MMTIVTLYLVYKYTHTLIFKFQLLLFSLFYWGPKMNRKIDVGGKEVGIKKQNPCEILKNHDGNIFHILFIWQSEEIPAAILIPKRTHI